MKNRVRMAVLAGCCFCFGLATSAQADGSGTKATLSSEAVPSPAAETETDQPPAPAARPGKGRTYTGGRRGGEVEAISAEGSAQPAAGSIAAAQSTECKGAQADCPASDARIGRITGAGGKTGIDEPQELAVASPAGAGECATDGDPAGAEQKACDAKTLAPIQQDKGHSEKGIK